MIVLQGDSGPSLRASVTGLDALYGVPEKRTLKWHGKAPHLPFHTARSG